VGGRLVLVYYALSLAGTAAYCLFWVEFSVPLLNVAWPIAMLVAGFAVEKQAAREDASFSETASSGVHAILSGVIGVYAVTWPLLIWAKFGDFLARPSYSPIVGLLGLGPFLFGSLIWRRRFRWMSPRILAGAAWVLILLPSFAWIGLLALETMMFQGHRLEVTEPVVSPEGAWAARYEYRCGGGVFADSYGGVWLESTRLPLRRQVYRFSCDGPLPEFRWKNRRRLDISPPADGHGERVGRPRLF